MIPNYSKHRFKINENDSRQEVLNKLYHLEQDRLHRQLFVEKQIKELSKQLNDFSAKYKSIEKMKGSGKTIDILKTQLAIEELTGD